jgi:hypothetical protein
MPVLDCENTNRLGGSSRQQIYARSHCYDGEERRSGRKGDGLREVDKGGPHCSTARTIAP